MYDSENLFETITTNQELEKNFHQFFNIHNLIPLFENAAKAGSIKTTDSDMRAVVNTHGAYHDDLVKLSNRLYFAMDNKSYDLALFRTIETPRSFQKFMIIVRNINLEFEHYILDQHKHNLWNIVFYSERIF